MSKDLVKDSIKNNNDIDSSKNLGKKTPTEVKKILSEFKEFAFRGNMIDLAVGIIIGGAFNNLVKSLVNNIIMPPIGKIIGNTNFSNLYLNLNSESYESLATAEAAGAPIIKYGEFITNLLDFLIMAFTIFIIVRVVIRQEKKGSKKQDKK